MFSPSFDTINLTSIWSNLFYLVGRGLVDNFMLFGSLEINIGNQSTLK